MPSRTSTARPSTTVTLEHDRAKEDHTARSLALVLAALPETVAIKADTILHLARLAAEPAGS